jgi:hypothetical protein
VPKIFLLNGSHDRETSRGSGGSPMSAADIVRAACDALCRRHGRGPAPALEAAPGALISALLHPRGGAIALDRASLEALGIRRAAVQGHAFACAALL